MRAHPVKIVAALAVAALTGVTLGVASAQAPKVIKVSIIEATPAFHSLPVTALKTLGADYGLQVETLQIQGGGEAGQIFAGGHGGPPASTSPSDSRPRSWSTRRRLASSCTR